MQNSKGSIAAQTTLCQRFVTVSAHMAAKFQQKKLKKKRNKDCTVNRNSLCLYTVYAYAVTVNDPHPIRTAKMLKANISYFSAT